MSRIGKMPIPLPKGVEVKVTGRQVDVKGPKGQLSHAVPGGVTVRVEEQTVLVERANNSKPQRAFHGLARALIANAVAGVTEGFQKNLEIHGVGYRAELKGKSLVFQLGYSHPVEYPVPVGIDVAVDRNTKISIKGIDKQQVGQVAAELRSLRPPDVYKLKGVRYENERLRKKAGKTGAA